MSLAIDRDVHRMTLDEYHQLIASGGLDESSHVELIDGLLYDMSPKSPEHENVVAFLGMWLARHTRSDQFQLRVRAPLTLQASEPEPDIAVVAAGTPRPYHPQSAGLVVEVAVSSHHRDLRVKSALYARADVGEYWVLDVPAGQLRVHRDPLDGAYRSLTTLERADSVTPLALATGPLRMAELLDSARP